MSLASSERKFVFKLEEFLQEQNLDKFNVNNKNLKFKNGVYKGSWFQVHKKEILESSDDKCKKIQEQYKEYRKLNEEEVSKKRQTRIKEFLQEKNLDKFNVNKKNLKFKDGSLMGVWFNHNKPAIINSDDEICLKILKQFYEYKNKPDMVNYIDEKINSKTLIEDVHLGKKG